jgi:Ser/Thr protein kinase RdoA (MazF antagonist)
VTNVLAGARARIAARPAGALVSSHLSSHYGIDVIGQSELDLGVYRIDRADGPAWVARLFPSARPPAATAGDAEILRFLAEQGFAAERAAAPDPLSAMDSHSVLVTEYVPGVPRTERRAAIKDAGGLLRLSEMLGWLNSLPSETGAIGRPGGGWHHLVDGTPEDEVMAVRDLLAECPPQTDAADLEQYAALQRAVADLDGGAGLPEAFLHPDYVLANVVASAERGMVLVDWTGAGRGPRAYPLAFLLYAEGARDLRRIDRVAAGYRRHVSLEPEELDRLEPMIRARPIVLAVWSYCLGRMSLANAARGVAAAGELAQAVAARAIEVLRGSPG